MAFEGTNFFRSIVTNGELDFRKNAAYALLRNPRHNRRGFMLKLTVRAVSVFSLLTDEDMVKRVLALGITADYILMDSWFCFPAVIAALSQHIPVICMAKELPNILCCHKNVWKT